MPWGNRSKKAEVKPEPAPVTQVIDTAATAAPEMPKPTAEELTEIKEQVDYYNKNYRGLFSFENPLPSEMANLLFAILQEIRKLREEVKNGGSD